MPPEDAGVGKGDALEHRTVVDQVLRGNLVRAVDDKIEVGEDLGQGLCRELLIKDTYRHGRVPASEMRGGGKHLALSDVVVAVNRLAVEIGELHRVAVDQPQLPDPRCCERQRRWTPKSSNAHHEHAPAYEI